MIKNTTFYQLKNITIIIYEEVSKKKVVSVHIWQVYWPQPAEIPGHTRGPQKRGQ